MAGTIQYASHANFSVGMVRDYPRHLLPEGAVWDATNIVITESGSLAKRGASVTAISAATDLRPTQVGSQKSANTDFRARLYPMSISAGVLRVGSLEFDEEPQPLHTFTTAISSTTVGEPTTYGDSIVFPSIGDSGPMAWCGGADFSETSSNYAISGITASTITGDNNIAIGATAASSVAVGGYIHLSNGGTNEYTGRIIATSASSVVVEPTPIKSISGASAYTDLSYYPVLPQVGTKNDGKYVSGAGCIGTFASGGDTRLVIGNVRQTDASSGAVTVYPNRIMWSVREASDATVEGVDGLVQATRAGFPKLNYIDIEDIGSVIGLVPIGSSNMLVLGTDQCVLLAGQLLTQADESSQSVARGGLTASIRGFPQKVGCISSRSIQRTSAGVMFAAADGVYLTDGSTMANTMTKKISNFWGDSLTGADVFTFDVSSFANPNSDSSESPIAGTAGFAPDSFNIGIYGSANINDSHYYVSLASGGFFCDLRAQFGWTRVQSGQLEIAGACVDADQTTNRVYAVKHDPNASGSNLDRVIRLDPIVLPADTNVDADGSEIDVSITTRAYTEGDPAQKRRYRHTMITYRFLGGLNLYPSSNTFPSNVLYPQSSNAFIRVSAIKGLDGGGSSSLIGVSGPSAQSSTVDRYDHQTISQAVTYVIDTVNAPVAFSLYEITNGFNQLRPGRIS
jgi:hypothetical protein